MPRSVAEWIGRTPDSPVPPRVRWRVFKAAGRRCAHCLRLLRIGARFTCDHIIALINGGENRETNLQILCDWCDPAKTAADVRQKAKVYRAGSKQFRGFRESGRPLPGSRASGIRKRMDGGVEAWS
jgi:5-methylcytosine-specific restriction protein A